MPFATTWMNLQDIMLSAISQTEKDKYCTNTYLWNLKKKKLIEKEIRLRTGWEMGELNEDGQKVKTSNYKTNKYWGCNV